MRFHFITFNEIRKSVNSKHLDAIFLNAIDKALLKENIEQDLILANKPIKEALFEICKNRDKILEVFQNESKNIYPKYKIRLTQVTYSAKKGGGQKERIILSHVDMETVEEFIKLKYPNARKTADGSYIVPSMLGCYLHIEEQ